jgi:hypothetical protein
MLPSQNVCASDMLLLLTVENTKVQMLGGFQWRNIHNKYHESKSTGSKVERKHKRTDSKVIS